MSKSTKTRLSTETYNTIYRFLDSDVSDVAILPDGMSLVKVNTKELIKNYAIQLTVAKMIGMSPSQQPTPIDQRKREESETPLTRMGESPEKGRVRFGRNMTTTMKRQLRELGTFLKSHPVKPGKRRYSLGARAGEFWHSNWRTLSAAAKETGERHGYLNPRSLADGARKAGLQWSD